MKKLSITPNENLKLFDKFNQFAFKSNNISQFVQNLSDNISSAIQPGIALNTSLTDLSAIADVTGDKLKEIEGYARDTAKTFGTDAASSVESYKFLLSQLSPELGNYPTALRAMGDNIVLLEKNNFYHYCCCFCLKRTNINYPNSHKNMTIRKKP